MVFDSPQAQSLLDTYANAPDFLAPESVFLLRSDLCKDERSYLEDCFAKVSSAKKQDWIPRLFSKDDRQHVSAWFEIMLFGWLSQSWEVEAIDKDGQPDFLVQSNSKKIIIEARAILISEEARRKDKFLNGIFAMLKKIDKPFVVEVHKFIIGNAFPLNEFVNKVTTWLDNYPDQFYEYQDRYGNKIMLSAKKVDNLTRVASIYSPGAFSVNSEPLKRPLKEKATKYQSIRHSKTPYVLALFLEDRSLSAEEVVEAWLGRTKYIIDLDTNKVIDQQSDLSGIHFMGGQVVHKTIAGTLVFNAGLNSNIGRRELNSWWVENPYATNMVDSTIFPVLGRYVTIERNSTNFKMAWKT